MQDAKMLTLGCNTFVGGRRDLIGTIFAHEGDQYDDSGSTLFHSPPIILVAISGIVHTPLTLILGDSSDIVTSVFAHNSSQYCDYG